MLKEVLAVLALAWPLVAIAQQDDGADATAETIEWPLPWKQGTRIEYDQSYRAVESRDGKQVAITGSDRIVLEIMRVDETGFVQRWTGTDPRIETGDLPESLAATLRATIEAMRDLAIDVQLDKEGAFAGIANLDEIHPRYREAMREMVENLTATGKPDAAAKAAVDRMIDMLTARPVLEQQLADIPAAYNFVSGGGLELDAEYEYEDSGTNPLGGEPIPMRNRLHLTTADDPRFHALTWEVEPDAQAASALAAQAAEQMLAPQAVGQDAGAQEELQQALEQARADAKFTTTVSYLVDKATGVIERMEQVEVKRFGGKDQTTTTLLQRRH